MKPKRSQSPFRIIEQMDDLHKPVNQILEDRTNNFVLDYIQLKSFLKNAIGNEDTIDTTESYTSDTKAVIHMLKSIPQDPSIKHRLHPLIKKTKNRHFNKYIFTI